MAMAGKKPNRKEKRLLQENGKSPSDWLMIKRLPDHIVFRHRIQESKELRIDI